VSIYRNGVQKYNPNSAMMQVFSRDSSAVGDLQPLATFLNGPVQVAKEHFKLFIKNVEFQLKTQLKGTGVDNLIVNSMIASKAIKTLESRHNVLLAETAAYEISLKSIKSAIHEQSFIKNERESRVSKRKNYYKSRKKARKAQKKMISDLEYAMQRSAKVSSRLLRASPATSQFNLERFKAMLGNPKVYSHSLQTSPVFDMELFKSIKADPKLRRQESETPIFPINWPKQEIPLDQSAGVSGITKFLPGSIKRVATLLPGKFRAAKSLLGLADKAEKAMTLIQRL
jgi:hypothetical protein